LQSSGIINAHLINWEEGSSTIIRYGFMNYYKAAGADENYLPMILRSNLLFSLCLFSWRLNRYQGFESEFRVRYIL